VKNARRWRNIREGPSVKIVEPARETQSFKGKLLRRKRISEHVIM
jgi:hypothetical protein